MQAAFFHAPCSDCSQVPNVSKKQFLQISCIDKRLFFWFYLIQENTNKYIILKMLYRYLQNNIEFIWIMGGFFPTNVVV